MVETLTVAELIELLSQFPGDATVFTGEGSQGEETAYFQVKGVYYTEENDAPEVVITTEYL